ncbi:helix-turn-helix domain-containing protein [Streptomyces litmocidini]|uniref:helix-turn-helix domain-containing protein n=1 Tax=Streptomyces litmocidini TaxID=67318 RepID=UPI00167ECA92|nr:helix-turn-helix transcriptional regulator [Streptomyces litmocidini]
MCAGGGRCRWYYGRPDVRLGPGIGTYRGFRSTAGVPQERLVVPSGRVSLLIGFGGELRVRGDGGHTSLVSGLHNRARVLGHGGDVHGVELALAPWAAHRFFGGIPLAELADVLADPVDVLGDRARRLGEALADAPGWAERFALLDETLLRWAAEADGTDGPAPAVLEAWRLLERSAGTLQIHEVAAATGFSPRHLERLFQEQIGLGPKRLARILRLNRAIRLLTAGGRPADTAARCGYYDQAHLSTEFKAMTGMPPGRFLADRGTSSSWIAG